jgi:hypothetical protein
MEGREWTIDGRELRNDTEIGRISGAFARLLTSLIRRRT